MSSTLRAQLFRCALLFAAPVWAQAQVTVSPASPTVVVGTTVKFSALVGGNPGVAVTWKVAGVANGNTTVGTIDATGLYTAPGTVPASSSLLVSASTTTDPKISGSTYVNIVNPGPVITSINPNPMAVGNFTVTINGNDIQAGATAYCGGVQLSTLVIQPAAMPGGPSSITAIGYQGAAANAVFTVRNPGSALSNAFTVPIAAKAVFNPSVTIKPASVNVVVSGTVQFSAQTTGLSPETVYWSIFGAGSGNATLGTVSPTGLYTAPATVPRNPPLVVALSMADGKTAATVYPYIQAMGPTITAVSPNPVPSGNAKVTITGTGFLSGAMVTGGGAALTTSSLTSTSISASLYIAPGTTSTTFCVRNPGTACGNVLTVPVTSPPPGGGGSGGGGGGGTPPPPSTPVVAPATISVVLGGTQQFTISNNVAVTSWTATAGTIDNTGLYTAPSVMPASSAVVITATGSGGSGNASVTLIPSAPPAITSINPATLPLGVFSITVNGSGFIPQSVVQLNGASLTTVLNGNALTVSGFAGTAGQGNLKVVNGPLSSALFPVQVGVASPLVSTSAARRFLEQAAFGATPAEADHVQAIGFQQWITDQFNQPVVSNFNGLGSQGGMPTWFLANAVTNPDQLRQRVAFALSEIFVTSLTKLIWNSTMIPYQQMLLADAFTNYPKILSDVTLSPAMGQYLDMANNAKANPAAGTVANENYAREVLQLFSIGTYLLNQDGSQQLDAQVPPQAIPAYDQFAITEFARVFTGWTYAPVPGGTLQWNAYPNNTTSPMQSVAAMHDTGSKTLLNGYVSPQGISAAQDLQNALNNIAIHQNVAPFISRQLIQHLVKSNPSAAYTKRVVDAFTASNGDMKTVITAILLDAEARANDSGGADQPSDGHLQEPALFLPSLVRAFGGTMTTANYYSSDMAGMGQDIYNSPSVFNYFSPGYTVGGTGGLKGPEFQINNPNSAILRENLVANLFNQYSNPVQSYGPGTTVDLTPMLPLASTPATLVDAVDLSLTHGTMPATMKQMIVNAVTADPGGNLRRVQTAIYLTLQSMYYNVWH